MKIISIMAKFFQKFDTISDYETAKATLDTPNICLVDEDYKCRFNKYVDPYAGHDYVKIGGLKWATMNIGATSVTDYGCLYFQWGDTSGYTASEVGMSSGKKAFSCADYKYGDGTTFSKYNETDSKTVLDLDDDAAHVNWGGSWRLPTSDDIKELLSSTTSAWTTSYEGSGIQGLVLTDKTDNTKKLFFPAAGYANSGFVDGVGSFGYYWSSSLAADEGVNSAFSLGSTRSSYFVGIIYRCNGCAVRPVVG